MGLSKPITIGGKCYPSQNAAAKALGISESAISQAVRRGTLNGLGAGRGVRQYVPVTIRGITYPSQTAACKALGVSRPVIWKARLRGTLDDVGRGPKPPPRYRTVIATPPPAPTPDPKPEITEAPAMPPHPWWNAERDVLLLRLASGATGALDYSGLADAARKLGKPLAYCKARFFRLVAA